MSRFTKKYGVVWAAIAAVSSTAMAADRYWSGGDGVWASNNWSATPTGPSGQNFPSVGDTVYLLGSSSYTVTYASPPVLGFNAITIDASDGALATLQKTGFNTIYAGFLNIGSAGFGQFDLNAGTYAANFANVRIGFNAGSAGTFTTSASTGVTVSNIALGVNGAGTFIQNGGSVIPLGGVTIGSSSTATGYYALNAGTLSAGTSTMNVVVGNGGVGQFDITGGTASVGFLSAGFNGITGRTGTVNVTGGRLNVATNTVVGNPTGATTGGIYISGGTVNLGGGITVHPGSEFVVTGSPSLSTPTSGSGAFVVNSGTLDFGTSAFGSSSVTPLTITDGYFAAGAISGILGGSINFQSGTILTRANFGTANFAALGGGTITLPQSKAFFVRDTTTLYGATPIVINGGTFGTGGLAGNVSGGLIFSSGTFRLTASQLSVGTGGPFGATLTVDPTRRYAVDNGYGVVVDTNGVVKMTGGELIASGGVYNYGLVSGSGRIIGPLYNVAGGETRVTANDVLRIESGAHSNDGRINLLGGLIEFPGGILTNSATGRITGRGALRADSIVNDGSILLSAGLSDISGIVTNNAAAKIIVTGNATATFYDPVTNATGSEFRVSSGSSAVFFSPVTGLSLFTGAGNKFFESTAEGGPLVTAGRSAVGPAGALAAAGIREAGLSVEGSATINGVGVSRLGELNIETGGRVDLTDDVLVIDYTSTSPLATIKSQIIEGYANGAWTGDGIRSSAAAINSRTAIGYAEASDLGSPATFLGESIDSTTVLIRYTLKGDADLDGTVSSTDFNRLVAGFGLSSTDWVKGDFNYDGKVDTVDFNLQIGNFGEVLPALPGALPSLGSVVPEPTGLGALAAMVVGGLTRRSRRRA